jgi:mRNA interferase YafQ
VYKIKTSSTFEKDFTRCIARKLEINHLELVLKLLEQNGRLPNSLKPHQLSGNFKGYWECHIRPDWLLIWRKIENTKTIELVRTGTHSDLFK